MFDFLPPGPFYRPEKTSYRTPDQRMAALKQLAGSAESLDAGGQARVATQLAQQMKEEDDPILREQIVRTLSRYSTPTAKGAIRSGLKDADPHVRIAATEMIAEAGGPGAAEVLAEVLQSDTDLDVRIAAARGLADYSDPAIVPALGVALDDPNPALQRRAIETLRETTGREFGNDLAAWRAYVRGETPTPKPPPSLAERLGKFRLF